MTVLCTILARGGSKGVPGKNLRLLGGKPLITHTLEQAHACGLFDVIALSSDDDAILEAGGAFANTRLVRRLPEHATDTASKIPALQHCVEEIERGAGTACSFIVDLQPTSPLRLLADIHAAVRLYKQSGAPNVITGSPSRCSPYFNMVEEKEDGSVCLSKPAALPIGRRQDTPACFDMNGSIYVWSREALMTGGRLFNEGTRLYTMPPERSVDIDTELDFRFAEFLLHSGQ